MFLGILLPRPLSNDPRFMHCIYRYSHASKLFVEVFAYIANNMDPDETALIEQSDRGSHCLLS